MAAESPVASATASTRPAASSDSGKVFGTPAWYPLPVLLPIQLAPVTLPDLDNDPGTDGSDCAICAISCQEKYGAQLNPGTSLDWRGSEGHMEGYACIFLKFLEKNMAQPQTPCFRARIGLKTPCAICATDLEGALRTRAPAHAHTHWFEKSGANGASGLSPSIPLIYQQKHLRHFQFRKWRRRWRDGARRRDFPRADGDQGCAPCFG